MFDALYPTGMHWYWKGDFVKDLSDEAIATHIEHASKAPTEASAMHLYPIDGAVHRRARGDSAWNARDAKWSMVIIGVDNGPGRMPAVKQWARDYWEAVHPYNLGGGYPNFMMDDEAESRLRATYGDNYERLSRLKAKYDPDNLFRVNHNIRPAA
jgi:FAD/FMN-containing dehydrogenase